jgi:hypothetical protein
VSISIGTASRKSIRRDTLSNKERISYIPLQSLTIPWLCRYTTTLQIAPITCNKSKKFKLRIIGSLYILRSKLNLPLFLISFTWHFYNNTFITINKNFQYFAINLILHYSTAPAQSFNWIQRTSPITCNAATRNDIKLAGNKLHRLFTPVIIGFLFALQFFTYRDSGWRSERYGDKWCTPYKTLRVA